MMKFIQKRPFLASALVASTLASAPALAEGNVRLGLGAIAGATGVTVDSDDDPTDIFDGKKFGWGAGALVEFPMAPMFGIQTGALYLQRTFAVGNRTLGITRSIPTLEIPLELKLWIGDVISLSAGGFGALRVGRVNDEATLGTLRAEFSSGQRKTWEWGLTAALGLTIPFADKTGVFAEARYNYGLTNPANASGYSEKMRDVLFMAGLRLDL